MTKLMEIYTVNPVYGMKLDKIDNKSKDTNLIVQMYDDNVIDDQITYNEIGMRA